ncbi:hypothetical protein ABIB49_003305 [Arthrobacter sp. UYCu512]|uniref:hypothetical protein n=1 Tax=Arthrobacter sp. UYCu512 TaxID=3156338 RepID=UPI0033910A72
MIMDLSFNAAAGSSFVTGYNLNGGQVQLKWTTAAGQVQDRTVAAAAYNPSHGQQHGVTDCSRSPST